MSADEKRALAAGLALLLCVCTGACRLGPGVDCPLGTYPVKVSSSRKVDGDAKAGVSVPTASGDASGRWSGAGETAWECKRLCPRGTAAKIELSKGRQVAECVPYTRPPDRDGGATAPDRGPAPPTR